MAPHLKNLVRLNLYCILHILSIIYKTTSWKKYEKLEQSYSWWENEVWYDDLEEGRYYDNNQQCSEQFLEASVGIQMG